MTLNDDEKFFITQLSSFRALKLERLHGKEIYFWIKGSEILLHKHFFEAMNKVMNEYQVMGTCNGFWLAVNPINEELYFEIQMVIRSKKS